MTALTWSYDRQMGVDFGRHGEITFATCRKIFGSDGKEWTRWIMTIPGNISYGEVASRAEGHRAAEQAWTEWLKAAALTVVVAKPATDLFGGVP